MTEPEKRFKRFVGKQLDNDEGERLTMLIDRIVMRFVTEPKDMHPDFRTMLQYYCMEEIEARLEFMRHQIG